MLRRCTVLGLLAIAGAAYCQSLQYVTSLGAMVDSHMEFRHIENNPDLQVLAINDPTGNVLSRAQIAPGINSVYAHWDSLNPGTPSSMLMSDAQTYWTDTVTIDDPVLNGTVGTFTASLRVFGSSSFTLTGAYASGDPIVMADVYGFWDSWIGTSTDGGASFLVGGWFGDWYSDETGEVYYTGDELNQPMTEVTLEFIYGQPFLLRMNMEAYFDAENLDLLPGTVEGTLDFSHTAYWNGIGGFFDANGTPTSPGFTSQSGVDWRNAVVPEPATLVAVVGLLLLTWRQRKHR